MAVIVAKYQSVKVTPETKSEHSAMSRNLNAMLQLKHLIEAVNPLLSCL